jgi:uncharacterized membrane protein YphA (DoxX/SURF4 family)
MDALIERLKALGDWLDARRDYFFDMLRIYLGIGLFVKGLQFIWNFEYLEAVFPESDKLQFLKGAILHYIPLAHLGGGLLLAVGLLTRVSALFQIPILLGAAFVVYLPEGVFSYNQDFQFTALVLFLLILILLHGPGPLSVDHYLRKRPGGSRSRA